MSQPAQAIPKPAGILTVEKARGFVVETNDPLMDRLIITAAHCLPSLPAAENAAVFSDESTYPNLLGPLGQPPTVCAQCLFADPVSDLAVLGPPDNQALFDQWEAYQDLLNSVTPFPVSDAPPDGQAWLYSLDQRWFPCHIERVNQGPIWISGATEAIRGGMSGSPIKADDGSVIGLVSRSSAVLDDDALKKLGPDDVIDIERDVVAGSHREGGPQPVLARSLPVWLRDDLFDHSPGGKERLYTIAELANYWRISSNVLRPLFENEEGVIKWSSGKTKTGQRKPYVSLRIPEPVAWRVYQRYTGQKIPPFIPPSRPPARQTG
jgi:hypothetical protein